MDTINCVRTEGKRQDMDTINCVRTEGKRQDKYVNSMNAVRTHREAQSVGRRLNEKKRRSFLCIRKRN